MGPPVAEFGPYIMCLDFRRKDIFIAVAVDIIRFQSYGLQDNVALLVLLHRKGEPPAIILDPVFLHCARQELIKSAVGCSWLAHKKKSRHFVRLAFQKETQGVPVAL